VNRAVTMDVIRLYIVRWWTSSICRCN